MRSECESMKMENVSGEWGVVSVSNY